MTQEIYLTGITTTGTPHIGNYVGAIRPCVAASKDKDNRNYYFLADFHALAKNENPDLISQSTLEIAAAWLALGLDTDNAVFYRQSDIPEIPELTWILTSMTAKGLMNRAHSYKAATAANVEGGSNDADKGITMALYSYPILMAADILMFKATKVPVGRDQKQHVEMARDIAQRFNHHYGDVLVLPDPVIGEDTALLSGSKVFEVPVQGSVQPVDLAPTAVARLPKRPIGRAPTRRVRFNVGDPVAFIEIVDGDRQFHLDMQHSITLDQ